jgi:hypothetical protein
MSRDYMSVARSSWQVTLVRLEDAVLEATDPRAKIEKIVAEWDAIIAKHKASASGKQLRRVLTELLELNAWAK